MKNRIMADNTDIALPVRFNPFKHHRNYILSLLEVATQEDIIGLLDKVCNNYIDIYTGAITPESIVNDVVEMLKSNQSFQFDDFSDWVAPKNGYQQIKLKDKSEWVIRKGDSADRYIHLHPGRTGKFILRFKGSSLKTIYLLKVGFKDPWETPSLEKVNQARLKIGLSPVKKLDRHKGILKCYETFFYNHTPANH